MGLKTIVDFVRHTINKFRQDYNEYVLNVNKIPSPLDLKGGNIIVDTEIGRNSYVSHNTIIFSTDIGKYCSIGPNVTIGYGDHPTNFLSTSPKLFFREIFPELKENPMMYYDSFKRVKIENDVWIGANCYIKNGVHIGNGAIIGAGSVVLKDVEEYSIVAGVPAKLIRQRFSDNIIDQLCELKWWNYSEHEIKKVESLLSENLTEEILSAISKTLNANI